MSLILRSEAIKMLDLRKPHLWYPMARALQRRLVYHMGPTNSGKTYNALQAMCAAESGLYCGPLRLLAMEVYDELNASGTFCNLTTGNFVISISLLSARGMRLAMQASNIIVWPCTTWCSLWVTLQHIGLPVLFGCVLSLLFLACWHRSGAQGDSLRATHSVHD